MRITRLFACTSEHVVNCVDRHAQEHPDRLALIWEKDEPVQEEKITYK